MIKICSDLRAVNSLPSLVEEIHKTKLDSNSHSCSSKHVPLVTEFWLSFYGGLFKVVVFTDEPEIVSKLSSFMKSHVNPPPFPRKMAKKEELELAKADLMSKRSLKCGSGYGSSRFNPKSKYCR